MKAPSVFLIAILSAVPSFSQDAECDPAGGCQKILETNPASSLAHYRIAELLFQQHNYQSAALEFFQALQGDKEPKWTEVWSHVNLGKIFDLSRQRDRAVREYRLAEQTRDNTRGARDEVAKYLESPYSAP